MRRLGLVVVAALASSLALAVPAQAARTVIFKGGGWGHGMGMSQYGAYGRALNGRSAHQILHHYYTGVGIRHRRMPHVRVGLLQGQTIIEVTSQDGPVVFKVKGSKTRIVRGGAGGRFRLEPSPTGGVRIFRNGTRVFRNGHGVFGSPRRPVIAQYERFGSRIHVYDKGISYAYGRLEFGTYNGCSGYCLRLVLPLRMQKYLYGLGEVPSSWPHAALEAQAIAGRTYAFRKAKLSGHHRITCDCTVYDSTLDQAYIGDSKRTGSGAYWNDWKGAVDRTGREVILYHGDPIEALYSSSSGGHTENNENVWGGTPLPYLRGVVDKADAVAANPNYRWRQRMSWATLSRKLDAVYNTGKLRRFRLVRPFGVSGRVTVVKPGVGGGVRIVGRARTARVDGYKIRSVLGLRDTLFRVRVRRTGEATTANEPRLQAASGSDATPATTVPEPDTYPVTAPFSRAYERFEEELGAPLGPDAERAGLPDGGRRQRFEGGTLYLTPSGGVFALWGRIDERYRSAGEAAGSGCGYPISDVVEAPDGSLRAAFEGGSIAWSPTSAVRVDCG